MSKTLKDFADRIQIGCRSEICDIRFWVYQVFSVEVR